MNVANLKKALSKLDAEARKITRDIELALKPGSIRAAVAHPDLCIYLERDFRRIGARHMIKKGARRGFLVVRFLCLSASIRW